MAVEKAYKLLALQENISNNEAKNLIDSGLVYLSGKKIILARGLINTSAKFKVTKLKKPTIIFEDENILAINKPEFINSSDIEKKYKFPLINRLDKETSGVILLAKNEEFRQKAIQEFKNLNVKKTYIAIVSGVVSEKIEINDKILTIKNNNSKGRNEAFSKISDNGKTAFTTVYPFMVSGKKSLVKIEIKTGRTHQIRVHLAAYDHAVIGDEKYAKLSSKRLFLHSYKTEILGYSFVAPLDNSFNEFGFEISKDMKF